MKRSAKRTPPILGQPQSTTLTEVANEQHKGITSPKMKTESKEQADRNRTHLARRILLGRSLREGAAAATIGTIISLCVAIIQFSFIQPLFNPAEFHWSLTGIASILFWICLFVIATTYSYTGGGLIDCCSILIPPTFISNLTFLSVAMTTGDPIPIWEWSLNNHFITNIRWAVSGALLWAPILGAPGFAVGAVVRVVNQSRAS